MKNDSKEINFVSIIIPSYNEEKYIGSCLSSIRQLDYPSEFMEIIVVDNGSVDRTIEIAKNFNCIIEVFPKINVSALRNRGAEIAKGDILAFLDADCVVNRDWLKNALVKFNNPKIGIVGCSQFLIPNNSSWVEKVWSSQKKKIEGYVNWVGSGNLLISKKLFERLNGFNEKVSTSEDCDLCFRLTKLGFKVNSTVRARVIHLKLRKTLLDFFKKEIWHGKGVLRSILGSKSNFKNFNALIFALFYVLCLTGIIISFISGLLLKNFFPLFIFISIMILLPFVLAIKKSSNKKNLLGLFILYLFYGIARAVCIFNCDRRSLKK